MNFLKSICFVTPGYTLHPSGGYKMIYEYANRLSERGYTVGILYLNYDRLKNHHVPRLIRKPLCNFLTFTWPKWFRLNKNVKIYSGTKRGYISEIKKVYDIGIATDVHTAVPTVKLFKDRKKAYFIQGYENWDVSDEYVQKTYKLGMKNIVISEWLKKIVDKYSAEPSVLIKNPIDLDVYKINKPLVSRKLHSIGLLYHTMPHKGLKYSLAAIKKIKQLYPDLEVHAFGVWERPEDFPSYIHYTRNATQEQTVSIYNRVSVWLCATIDEGYGLTGLEAMACGDALVSTAYTGVFEYAKDGYNALLSPVKDVDALVKNVGRVFEDDGLRKKLVQNAQDSVEAFDWNLAVDKFEETLNE